MARKRPSQGKIELPKAPEDAETVKEISVKRQIGTNATLKLLHYYKARGQLRVTRAYREDLSGRMVLVPVYWLEV